MTAAITDADRERTLGAIEILSSPDGYEPDYNALDLLFAAHRIQARKEAIEEAARVAETPRAGTVNAWRARDNIAAAIRALGEGDNQVPCAVWS